MSNDKSGRYKLVNSLMAIIFLIVAAIFGIDLVPIESENPKQPTQTVQQEQNQNSQVEELENEKLVVHMIDVGQADCFLLVQDETTALVDCGTRSTGEDAIAYIKELGITQLDYVFGTHPHDDHMGGMYDVITSFEIGTIVIPKVKAGDVTSNWYQKLMQEISTGKYAVNYVNVGDEFELGVADMKVIGPINDPEGELNNYSTVLKVSLGEMDMIMTGDAEKEVEEDILNSGENVEAEILKLGHHGSDTSTSEEFLNAIKPDYALISCKVGNKYEHPTKSTMELLEAHNIEVYRTDESGSVVMTVTSSNVGFDCEPGDYLSGVELEERNSK